MSHRKIIKPLKVLFDCTQKSLKILTNLNTFCTANCENIFERLIVALTIRKRNYLKFNLAIRPFSHFVKHERPLVIICLDSQIPNCHLLVKIEIIIESQAKFEVVSSDMLKNFRFCLILKFVRHV